MATQKEDKCVRCPHGQLEPGERAMTMGRGDATLVVKGVPARVCDTCGEAYLAGETVGELRDQMDAAVRAGTELRVQRYRRVGAA